MTTRDLLVARFEQVRRSLGDVVSQLTDDMLDWSPAPGLHTIRGQLFEIVGKEIEFLAFAKAKGKDEWVEIETHGPREATVEGWKSILGEVRAETLAYLDSLSAAELDELVHFPESNWWEGLYRSTTPMHEVFRSIAAHEWYHTGQLVIYLGLREG